MTSRVFIVGILIGTLASGSVARASDTGQAPPESAQRRPELQVQLRTDEPHMTFFLKTGVAVGSVRGHQATFDTYRPLCMAPCTTSVPAGRQVLGLGRDDRDVVAAPPVVLQNQTQVEATRIRRNGMRAAGVAVLLGGIATFLALSIKGAHDCAGPPSGGCDATGTFMAGAGVLVASLGLGFWLGGQPDAVELRTR